jgi:hypothetical protein
MLSTPEMNTNGETEGPVLCAIGPYSWLKRIPETTQVSGYRADLIKSGR